MSYGIEQYKIARNCKFCGLPLEMKTVRQQFCNTKCRSRWHGVKNRVNPVGDYEAATSPAPASSSSSESAWDTLDLDNLFGDGEGE